MNPITEAISRLVKAQVSYELTVARIPLDQPVRPTTTEIELAKAELSGLLNLLKP